MLVGFSFHQYWFIHCKKKTKKHCICSVILIGKLVEWSDWWVSTSNPILITSIFHLIPRLLLGPFYPASTCAEKNSTKHTFHLRCVFFFVLFCFVLFCFFFCFVFFCLFVCLFCFFFVLCLLLFCYVIFFFFFFGLFRLFFVLGLIYLCFHRTIFSRDGDLEKKKKLCLLIYVTDVLNSVYYPDVEDSPNTFAVHIFIGGLAGFVPVSAYADILGPLAGHGYVVITPRTRGIDTENLVELILWVKLDNVQRDNVVLNPDVVSFS